MKTTMTVRAAARRLGVHENTIRNWCNAGHLAADYLPSGVRRIPDSEVERLLGETQPPSYHDVHVTTQDIPRTAISDLPFGYEVTCNRVGGWCLWRLDRLVAGEYDEPLRIDIRGTTIVDSFPKDET